MFVIVSLTTIPVRKDFLLRTLPYILKQKFVKKICINLDNNLSKEDYDFYDSLVITDSRIEINKDCDPHWRSANKLLPTIMRYPNDVIVTMDDDFAYDENCVKDLIEAYEEHPDCIISHEINPVICVNGKLEYINSFDIKLRQKEIGKYLSNCCLFPPHVFAGTDVFNYEKMMKLTGGTHDELWFWEQTVLKGVKTIGLDSTISLTIDSEIKHSEDDYQLTNINKFQDKVAEYNRLFNEEYGDRIQKLLNDENTYVEFYLNKKNFLSHVYALGQLKALYSGYRVIFTLDRDIKPSYIWLLQVYLQKAEFKVRLRMR